MNFPDLRTVELRPVPKRVASTGHSLEAEVPEGDPEEVPEEDPEMGLEEGPEEVLEEVDVAEVAIEIEDPNPVEVAIHQTLDHLNGH